MCAVPQAVLQEIRSFLIPGYFDPQELNPLFENLRQQAKKTILPALEQFQGTGTFDVPQEWAEILRSDCSPFQEQPSISHILNQPSTSDHGNPGNQPVGLLTSVTNESQQSSTSQTSKVMVVSFSFSFFFPTVA